MRRCQATLNLKIVDKRHKTLSCYLFGKQNKDKILTTFCVVELCWKCVWCLKLNIGRHTLEMGHYLYT